MRAPYIVWSPEGTTEPKVTHPNHKSACHAAHQMAQKNPGQTFYVMGAGGRPARYPVEGEAV